MAQVKELFDQVCEIITSDTPRGAAYNSLVALDIRHVEALRAIRLVLAEATKRKSELQAKIDKLKALMSEDSRFEVRANELAMDVLRELREYNGPDTETGMYKVDLNDGTFVSLIVSPTESVEVNPECVDDLPDELVKIERTPRLDIIKSLLKLGHGYEGCTLITRKYGTNPPADESVRWKKI